MLYHIKGLWPRINQPMSGYGFEVMLYPDWQAAVGRSNITQKQIDYFCENYGRSWLAAYGFTGQYDRLDIGWGAWGPEHIIVPGVNCAGINNDDFCQMGAPRGGRILTPHNIDTLAQAGLILTAFLYLADGLVIDHDRKKKTVNV